MRWRKRLEKAINSKISKKTIQRMKKDSGGWESCYIGENNLRFKKAGISVDLYCGPKDRKLEDLGYAFMSAIFNEEFEDAQKIANRIDKIIEKGMAKKSCLS